MIREQEEELNERNKHHFLEISRHESSDKIPINQIMNPVHFDMMETAYRTIKVSEL